MTRILIALLGLCTTLPAVSQSVIADFTKEADGKSADAWNIRTWNGHEPTLTPLKCAGGTLVIPLNFPARAEIVTTKVNGWADATDVTFLFKAPSPLPTTTILTFFTKDNDHLWRQIRLKCPKPAPDGTFSVTLPVKGHTAVAAWSPCGHGRTWTSLTATNLLEYGIIAEQDTGVSTPFQGELHLISVKALAHPIVFTGKVSDLEYTPAAPEVGDIIEVTFRMDCWPTAPFDSAKTSIEGTVTTPAGASEAVRGFYYEDFLYDPEEWDKTRCLTPDGKPCFKLRYCPRTAGPHALHIKCDVDGIRAELPEITFTARPPVRPFHGFIRRDSGNDQFFMYDDGTVFPGLGINVRSPFDNRYREVAPYSLWQDMGMAAYDSLFKKYHECGINVVEVWMCSWWLALEWINDAPGFHGVGHYNQYRAWMLDHIFRLAHQNNINLLLVINNHGKFAMHFDTEWARNPYNKVNGGYLEKCEEYFTNQRARNDTKRLFDYITARWAANPGLIAWKLFTEVDLTGPDLAYYHNPAVAAWHTEMGDYLKKIDPYKHMVTTHWMLNYQRINDAIANLPQLDFLSTDTYYNAQPGGTAALLALLNGSRIFAKAHKKPLVITEFGGSSYADSMTNLVKQLTIGMWTGFFNEMGILPMYWWFALVEDKELYPVFSALSAFSEGEDRRKMTPTLTSVPNANLSLDILQSPDRILAWLFDNDFYLTDTENVRPSIRTAQKITVRAPKPGQYIVQFWNSLSGTVISTTEITIKPDDKSITLTLPDFTKHTALKILQK